MTELLRRENDRALIEQIMRQTIRHELSQPHWEKRVELDYLSRVAPGSVKRFKWEHTEQGAILVDAQRRVPLILFPLYSSPICIGPSGQRTLYTPVFHSVPSLVSDVIGLVMRWLPATDLLSCRQVSRQWCQIASSNALWKPLVNVHEHLVIDRWSSFLPLHVQFVQYGFVGVSYEQLVKFIVDYPQYLAHIFCCNSLSVSGKHRLIPERFRVACWAKHRRYWIPEDRNMICTDHRVKNVDWYVWEYRCRLEGHKK